MDTTPVDVRSSTPPTGHTTMHRKPLQLSGALDGTDYFDVTPCIGREFRNVDIAQWLQAPNSDDILRDLAITSKSS